MRRPFSRGSDGPAWHMLVGAGRRHQTQIGAVCSHAGHATKARAASFTQARRCKAARSDLNLCQGSGRGARPRRGHRSQAAVAGCTGAALSRSHRAKSTRTSNAGARSTHERALESAREREARGGDRHAARAAAWRAGGDQGHHRRRGLAHARQQPLARVRAAGRQRCRDRAGAEDRRRHRAGQGAHHRVRILRSLAGAQPSQHQAYARRIEFGLGGGGGRGHGADCGRDADGRVGQPAGGLLRHCGIQAEHAQPGDVRHYAAGALLRYAGFLRLERGRCSAATRRSRRRFCGSRRRARQRSRA